MAGAFDLTGPQAAENFAELAEDLLMRSGEQETTNAAGQSETKSLAMQQLEATRAQVAVQLAQFHSFHVRPGDKAEWSHGDDGRD
jgi:hypothetical protein